MVTARPYLIVYIYQSKNTTHLLLLIHENYFKSLLYLTYFLFSDILIVVFRLVDKTSLLLFRSADLLSLIYCNWLNSNLTALKLLIHNVNRSFK